MMVPDIEVVEVAHDDFAAFFRAEYPGIVALATAVTGNRQAGEDIAAEAMSRAFRRWDRISTYDRPGAWTRRVTINLSHSRRRRFSSELRGLLRLRDEVAGTVDIELAYEQSLRRGGDPSRSGVVLAAVAVVALVAGAFLVRPGNGNVDVAVDEDEDGTTTTEAGVPDGGRSPAPISLGAPDDGKESVGLPVTADPSTGLTDGQIIRVTGTGFPPGEAVGVVMCAKEAGAEHGARGVDACNIGHFSQGTTDEQGNVSLDFSVRRLVVLDGEEIDCASEPGRCILGMGLLSDYDQSGGVAIDFDPSVPLPDPPTVKLSETTNIADGEVVGATIEGLVPNTFLSVQQCPRDQTRCAGIGELTADAAGSFDGGIRLWRNFGTWTPVDLPANVDCAVEACVLHIGGEAPGGRQIPPVPIDFDPNRGERVAAVFELVEPGPFAEGDTVELTVEELDANTYIDATVCPRTAAALEGCFAYSGAEYDGSGTLELPISFDRQRPDEPCADGCVLMLSPHPPRTGGPPPLIPDPIPITIAS